MYSVHVQFTVYTRAGTGQGKDSGPIQRPLGTKATAAIQCSAVQCSTVQCSAVEQCNIVQYSALQGSAVQCSGVQSSVEEYSAVQDTTLQCNTALYSVQCGNITEQCSIFLQLLCSLNSYFDYDTAPKSVLCNKVLHCSTVYCTEVNQPALHIDLYFTAEIYTTLYYTSL